MIGVGSHPQVLTPALLSCVPGRRTATKTTPFVRKAALSYSGLPSVNALPASTVMPNKGEHRESGHFLPIAPARELEPVAHSFPRGAGDVSAKIDAAARFSRARP